MSCVPWPKWKKETALTQLLVDGDVDGADLGPVPHMHTVDCLFWSTLFKPHQHNRARVKLVCSPAMNSSMFGEYNHKISSTTNNPSYFPLSSFL